MIDVDALSNELTDISWREEIDPGAMAWMQVRVAIATAEQMKRIADVLETFRSEGVPVVDVSSESSVSLAETIAAQHDANLYR